MYFRNGGDGNNANKRYNSKVKFSLKGGKKEQRGKMLHGAQRNLRAQRFQPCLVQFVLFMPRSAALLPGWLAACLTESWTQRQHRWNTDWYWLLMASRLTDVFALRLLHDCQLSARTPVFLIGFFFLNFILFYRLPVNVTVTGSHSKNCFTITGLNAPVYSLQGYQAYTTECFRKRKLFLQSCKTSAFNFYS